MPLLLLALRGMPGISNASETSCVQLYDELAAQANEAKGWAWTHWVDRGGSLTYKQAGSIDSALWLATKNLLLAIRRAAPADDVPGCQHLRDEGLRRIDDIMRPWRG